MSFLERIFTTDPTSLAKEQKNAVTSPGIEALKTAVAANDNGGPNVVQIIPTQPKTISVPQSEAGTRRRGVNPNISNFTLPETHQNSESEILPKTESIKEISSTAEIAPDHMLEAPKVSDEMMLSDTSELPIQVRITGEDMPVQTFLPEIFQLLKVGKQLDALILHRGEQAEKNSKVKIRMEEALARANNIQESISSFLVSLNVEESRQKLVEALAGYEIFLNAFQAESGTQESLLRLEDNKLITEMNGLKSKISGLMKMVGGMENFDRIKTVFKKLNSMRQKTEGYEKSVITEAHVILQERNTPENAGILQELAGSNKIIEIFTFMYVTPVNDN